MQSEKYEKNVKHEMTYAFEFKIYVWIYVRPEKRYFEFYSYERQTETKKSHLKIH